MKKVLNVIAIPKDDRITLEFEDGTFKTDVILNLNFYDWWGEFEGIGDLNIWHDWSDTVSEKKVTIYPDSKNMNNWYNPTLTIIT